MKNKDKETDNQEPKEKKKLKYKENSGNDLETLKKDIKDITEDIRVTVWSRVDRSRDLRQYLKFKEEFDSIIKFSTELFKGTPQSINIYNRNLEEIIRNKEEGVIPHVQSRYFNDKIKFINYGCQGHKLERFKDIKSYMLHISKILMIEPNNEELKDPALHHRLAKTIGLLIAIKIWIANKEK